MLKKQGKQDWQSEEGFTLLQLIVVLVLSSIVAGLGTPELVKMKEAFSRFNARSSLLEDIKRAQAQTITEGCRGVFAIAPDGKSYSFGCDYLNYDSNPLPQPDAVSFGRSLPTRVYLSVSTPIIFDSRGQAVDTSGIVNNSIVTLSEGPSGSGIVFATGTLLGTGVFNYD